MLVVPIGNKVIVERADVPETTAGGLVLPERGRAVPQTGRVLSVGDGTLLPDGRRLPLQVHEGDRVLFADGAGAEVHMDHQEVLILNEGDILAVIR